MEFSNLDTLKTSFSAIWEWEWEEMGHMTSFARKLVWLVCTHMCLKTLSTVTSHPGTFPKLLTFRWSHTARSHQWTMKRRCPVPSGLWWLRSIMLLFYALSLPPARCRQSKASKDDIMGWTVSLTSHSDGGSPNHQYLRKWC